MSENLFILFTFHPFIDGEILRYRTAGPCTQQPAKITSTAQMVAWIFNLNSTSYPLAP